MDEKQTEATGEDTSPIDFDNSANTSQGSELEVAPGMHDATPITWTASEFMDHTKSASWYIGLLLVAVALSVGFYALFRDLITAIVILVAAAALGFYARRQPRQLEYQLDSQGLSIESKHFPYSSFRSFSVVDEGPFGSIAFMPLKRFGLIITVYFDPQDEDHIVELIGEHLPLEPHTQDAVDRFMTRIRF
jgi:hypothetical protein